MSFATEQAELLHFSRDMLITKQANGIAQACMVSDALECCQDADNPDVVIDIKASAATAYAAAVET
ncbi:hypothetical protein AZE42_11748, partial [Rhizopogon vesiculosus]